MGWGGVGGGMGGGGGWEGVIVIFFWLLLFFPPGLGEEVDFHVWGGSSLLAVISPSLDGIKPSFPTAWFC